MEDLKTAEQEASQKEPGKHFSFPVIIIISLLFSSLFGAVFGFMGGKLSNSDLPGISGKLEKIIGKQKTSESVASREKIVEEDSTVISLVEKSSPSVVSIVITKDVPKFRSFFDDPFGFFSNPSRNSGETEKQQIGGGSGFIVDPSGIMITNKHVAQDQSAEYTAITNDGKEYPAKIMARDPVKDIAVMKIEGAVFPSLEFGNSDDLKVGQTVIAIGNSLGEFSNSVSKGIISGLKRSITAGSGFGQTEQLNGIIQTDAAINSGNSGGPLLDISGKVIGVNVAMAQGAENVGFSIPSNQVKIIFDQVKNTGKISTPFLGVRTISVDEQIQKENNLPFNYGALIARGEKITDFAVIPGSPADKAGIVENDIILEINGEKIDSKNNISDAIGNFTVGNTISIKIWHKGETKNIQVKLEERK